MARIIIDFPDDMEAQSAVWRVLGVVRQGKISEAGGVPHYCWASTFGDKSVVYTRRKKPGQESDSFIVEKERADAEDNETTSDGAEEVNAEKADGLHRAGD